MNKVRDYIAELAQLEEEIMATDWKKLAEKNRQHQLQYQAANGPQPQMALAQEKNMPDYDFKVEMRQRIANKTLTDIDIRRLKAYFIKIAQDVCPKFSLSDAQKQVVADIFRWCILDPNGKYDLNKGFWISGGIGSGKSTMLEIVKRFCKAIRPLTKRNVYQYYMPSTFRTSGTLEVISAFQHDGYEGLLTFIESQSQAFDDLGTEPSKASYFGMVCCPMEVVLIDRYNRHDRVVTHVTTNLTDGEVAEVYGARVFDRCREMFNFIVFDGVSHRA